MGNQIEEKLKRIRKTQEAAEGGLMKLVKKKTILKSIDQIQELDKTEKKLEKKAKAAKKDRKPKQPSN